MVSHTLRPEVFRLSVLPLTRNIKSFLTVCFSAEKVLSSGGYLVLVTFHSIEDRIVKRFIQARTGKLHSTSRYMPGTDDIEVQFTKITRKAVKPSIDEISINPRSRSAKLRIAKKNQYQTRTKFRSGRIKCSNSWRLLTCAV